MEFRQVQDSPIYQSHPEILPSDRGGSLSTPSFQNHWDDTHFKNGLPRKGGQLSLKGSKASICKKGSSGFGNGFINGFGSREIPRPPKAKTLSILLWKEWLVIQGAD